ncbi:glycosyltransferase family 2 protein [Xylanibacter oryzae]|uniref:glycosyltransferase family 2 protein n=1 Tax=Xylanibacter oryzae TaxID=185293 RepID=UPI0004B5196F|nr:glycosyltransferase family 2 protein [Xylanibacter oryzae]
MITVIIPLFNKEATIGRAIESIIKQTIKDWELIIVDDGSTDNSANAVNKYISDERISYHYKENAGVSNARNFGLKLANGEWVIFIDADDYFLPCAFQILLGTVKKFGTMISTANFYVEKNKVRNKYSKCKKERISKNNFRDCFWRQISPRAGSTLIKTSIAKTFPYNESLYRYEDGENLCFLMRKYKIANSPVPVMVYSLDSLSLSKSLFDIKKDFISVMIFEKKNFWEKVWLGELLIQGLILYKAERAFLIKKYLIYLWILPITKVLMLVRKLHFFIEKIFKA